MKRIAIAMLAALALAGCQQGSATPSKEELRKLSDKESAVLLECQGEKVIEDMGSKEGEDYMVRELEKLVRDKDSDSFLQYELAKEGYYCTEKERQKLIAQQRKAEQEALFGPAVSLQDMDPGLLGGAFVGEVEYKIDKESTGNWMGVADVKELVVSATAETEAEVVELAKTLKDKEAGGVDIVRTTFYSKKDLDKQSYSGTGTICIIMSEDGLTFFGDQYPNGQAYEQAKEDFKNGDGIVFIGSTE